MLLDLLQFYPLDWVWLQHPVDQVPDLFSPVIVEEVTAVFYFLKKYWKNLIVKGQSSIHHGIKNNSTRPDVNLRSTIGRTRNNFRSGVVGTTTSCRQADSVLHTIGKAEVNQLNVIVFV